ncbi:DUF1127 domain-containing protein [Ruegeria arenilitoris]|uniref:DUF1127 domain-containing protein n=1 Tax=Ruegeria arenilitoris TaxID=1173585 RepID=UPI00147C3525|nr:DUF1127 domain-containing protein [Ruegeria arenilitoris]
MATAQTTPSNHSLFHDLFAKYAEAKTERFRKQIFAKTVRDLERLSDQQLHDIGISRSDIPQTAYQSVYQRAALTQ